MPNQQLTIDAVIAGRAVSRDEVLAWEAGRLPKAARKIGLPVPVGDLARQRMAFTDSKLALGATEIRRRLARDIRLAGVVARGSTHLSFGRRATSGCDLHVTGGSAGTGALTVSASTPPASCVRRQISMMDSSNTPCVEG